MVRWYMMRMYRAARIVPSVPTAAMIGYRLHVPASTRNSPTKLPGMGSFVGEFPVLAGTWSRYPIIAAVGTLGTVLAALYILNMYQRTMTGPVTDQTREHITSDATWLERLAIAPVCVLLLALGFCPKPVLDRTEQTAKQAMTTLNVSDPARIVGQGR